MRGKKERTLVTRQRIRSNQSRPIILNRRSLSSSSIPRKKKDIELPCTSRDESHILHVRNDTPEPFHSQTVSLPSHNLLMEDAWKVGEGFVSTAYSNSANNSIQQPYNLILGPQQLTFSHPCNTDTMIASNPYFVVGHGTSVGQRGAKPLVMYNASVNSSSNENLLSLDNPSRRILLTDKGRENTSREIPIPPSQTIKPMFLENTLDRGFQQSRVAINEFSGNEFMDDSLSTISWMGQIQATSILPSIDPPRNFEAGRPPYSYMALIQFAINSSPIQRMTLKQIYNWIEETFPYFKHAKPEILPSSKSSFWTLRKDLNQRPLTLACVAARMGNIQPVPLSSIGVSSDGSTGLKQLSNIAQPYVLMPVNQNCSTPILKPKSSDADPPSSSFKTLRMQQANGDSGFNLEMSDLSLSHANEDKKDQSMRKRKRKQPLKILNDSLNDSLHFTESLISPLVSPLLQDEDSETTSSQFCNSTPTSMWIKHEPRRTSFESESGYFEQTRSSVTSADLLLTPRSHYDVTNSSAGRTTSSNESELRCVEGKHSSKKSTCVSIGTPKGDCADPNVGIFARNEDTGSFSVSNFANGESLMTDGLPQLLGMEGFSFNSSFAKLLNSSSVSLLNLSDRSVQFSDFEDV